MFSSRNALAGLTAIALMVSAAPSWAADKFDAIKASLGDFVKMMDGIKKEVSPDINPAALARVLERWAAGNESLAKAMQDFGTKKSGTHQGRRSSAGDGGPHGKNCRRPRRISSPPHRLWELWRRSTRTSPEVQKAVEKLKASLGAFKAGERVTRRRFMPRISVAKQQWRTLMRFGTWFTAR